MISGHEPQAEQDTSAKGGTPSHAPRLTPRRLTAAGLAVAGACFGGLNLLAGGTDVALLVLTAILLVSAGVSLLPSRPAPAFGACVAGGICLGGPFFQPYTRYHLTHTDQYAAFALTFLVISAGVVAVVAGIAAAVRPGEGSAPPWLGRFVVFVTGVSFGALLIGAIAPTGTDAVTASVEMGPAHPLLLTWPSTAGSVAVRPHAHLSQLHHGDSPRRPGAAAAGPRRRAAVTP